MQVQVKTPMLDSSQLPFQESHHPLLPSVDTSTRMHISTGKQTQRHKKRKENSIKKNRIIKVFFLWILKALMSLAFYFVSDGLILNMSEFEEKKILKRLTDFITVKPVILLSAE